MFGSNTTGVTNGEGTAYPTGPPESARSDVFSGIRVTRSLVFKQVYFSSSLHF
jgi:hypothetical protein